MSGQLKHVFFFSKKGNIKNEKHYLKNLRVPELPVLKTLPSQIKLVSSLWEVALQKSFGPTHLHKTHFKYQEQQQQQLRVKLQKFLLIECKGCP